MLLPDVFWIRGGFFLLLGRLWLHVLIVVALASIQIRSPTTQNYESARCVASPLIDAQASASCSEDLNHASLLSVTPVTYIEYTYEATYIFLRL